MNSLDDVWRISQARASLAKLERGASIHRKPGNQMFHGQIRKNLIVRNE